MSNDEGKDEKMKKEDEKTDIHCKMIVTVEISVQKLQSNTISAGPQRVMVQVWKSNTRNIDLMCLQSRNVSECWWSS
jgi:hypothetical protein